MPSKRRILLYLPNAMTPAVFMVHAAGQGNVSPISSNAAAQKSTHPTAARGVPTRYAQGGASDVDASNLV